ncbi:hypothetical protein AAKU52_000358 [Pedobacter sp. CG_S7]|uniref:Dabb family protein n=1 Tax=Pedobacter sp. CG_S7 TaxID=3143930 RepID=UPI003390A924
MDHPNRRKFIGTAAILVTSAAAVAASPLMTIEKKHPIVHHVFFWLKNPDSKEDRDQLIAGIKALSKINTIKGLHVGIVADTEKRDVIDQSWSVSELIFFDDLAGQAVYQNHPLHLEFIKNCSLLWTKVVVYDVAEA